MESCCVFSEEKDVEHLYFLFTFHPQLQIPQRSPLQITVKAVEVGGPEAELYMEVGPEEEEEARMK